MDQIEDVRAADLIPRRASRSAPLNCVYLVSISPKALAAADEQGVPTRNSASAIFDEMVWVEPLDLTKARELLNGRVIGLPDAFIKLCYVLSGGLPKDLLRIARTVSAIKPGTSGGTPELAQAVTAAITDELDGLVHRAMADVASLGDPGRPGLAQTAERQALADKLIKHPR